MAQSTIVPSAPSVELAISSDSSAVCAPTSNMDHMFSCLFPIEGCNHRRLFEIPEKNAKMEVNTEIPFLKFSRALGITRSLSWTFLMLKSNNLYSKHTL